MTQRISAVPSPSGYPLHIEIALTCEGNHGLFHQQAARFTGDDYIALRAQASAAGWRKSGIKWLGPCCSGSNSK